MISALGVRSVLDYGCGWGKDVEFYRANALVADGYDPEPRFGWTTLPSQQYDLVCVVFVINVLPSVPHRLAAVRSAASFSRPGGYVLIAARSPRA